MGWPEAHRDVEHRELLRLPLACTYPIKAHIANHWTNPDKATPDFLKWYEVPENALICYRRDVVAT